MQAAVNHTDQRDVLMKKGGKHEKDCLQFLRHCFNYGLGLCPGDKPTTQSV
jgi:hypothetical protein